MGGLALKNTKTRRYERKEFDVISVELIDMLKKDFKRVAMPLFYKNKQSFGDADLIVSMEDFKTDMRAYITHTFHPNEIFHNGNCWSFDYKELQVDLITLAPEHFDSNEMYLSYNDLGNYIGKIAHGFGLKYGQEGLFYDHYFKGTNIGRIYISKDYESIFKFFDLSYARWKEGFNELEDIFVFVVASKYFNWEYLQLENNNRINRERDIKRKSYMSFLEWIDKNAKDDAHKYPYNTDKSVYIDMIDEGFPEAQLDLAIKSLEYNHCKSLYIKAKFNGGEVMRRYGLKGKELGDTLNAFKEEIENTMSATYSSFEEYAIESTIEEIYNDFDDYYKRKQTA